MVVICCVCEKVHDDIGVEIGQETWQDFRIYMAKHLLKLRDVRLSHGYCPTCLACYRTFLAGLDTTEPQPEKERHA